MALLKIKTEFPQLTSNLRSSYISTDTASGSGTLSLKNIQNFAVNQILLIGEWGLQSSEIIKTHASTVPSGTTVTLASNTTQNHSAGTQVYILDYDTIILYSAATATGTKHMLVSLPIKTDSQFTEYNDTAGDPGYRFSQFSNSITSAVSVYSDPIPLTGYTQLSARPIIDSALSEIGKKTSAVLSDDFAFQQIDNCQMEVIREMKRWSFMQKFDQSIGELTTGQWKVALPTDCDDQNTNKSIYNFRIGKGSNLTWVDKEKWNDLIQDIAYTTLAANIIVGAVTITLTDSSNFDDSGTITIGANTYSYSANNRSTNVLTITASTTTNTSGQDVFQGAGSGNPQYWTTFGGYVYFYPILASTYNQRDAYMDYYSALIRTTTDTQTIVVPDPTLVQYYLMWKFMLKANNGEPTIGSTEKKDLYKERLAVMKKKESLNRTFQLRPLQNKFRMGDGDSKDVRLGGFI